MGEPQEHAVQSISALAFWSATSSNELLGKYEAQIVSVHDPDEYLSSAKDDADLAARKADVLGAYKALSELKAAGKVKSIGVGAKDISVIDFITDHVQLDWAMFACSITPYTHTLYAQQLLGKLRRQGVEVINSAVFNQASSLAATTLITRRSRGRPRTSLRGAIASTSSAPNTSSRRPRSASNSASSSRDRRGRAQPTRPSRVKSNVELGGGCARVLLDQAVA